MYIFPQNSLKIYSNPFQRNSALTTCLYSHKSSEFSHMYPTELLKLFLTQCAGSELAVDPQREA